MATHSSVLAWRIPGMGGAWWAAISGVAQSRTRLKRLSSISTSIFIYSLFVIQLCPYVHVISIYPCLHPPIIYLSGAKLLQSCLTLCDPMDCSPPGSSVRGLLQARTLEWVAISSSRELFPTQGSNLGLLYLQADSLPSEPLGKPNGRHNKR